MKRKLDLDAALTGSKRKQAKHGPSATAVARHGEESQTDAARASVVSILHKALVECLRQGDGNVNDHLVTARAIEAALFEDHRRVCDKGYKAAARSLSANLKRNQQLAQQVIDGDVLPSDLVRMDPSQLATQELKKQLSDTYDRQLRMATIHDSHAVVTSDYVCPECKSTACSYVDSCRRDVGKSETWGAKQHEGKERSVSCLTCGHKWEASLAD